LSHEQLQMLFVWCAFMASVYVRYKVWMWACKQGMDVRPYIND